MAELFNNNYTNRSTCNIKKKLKKLIQQQSKLF